MKSHEEIKNEIEYLEKQRIEWISTLRDKRKSSSLITEIYFFKESLESRYSEYFDTQYPNIHIRGPFIDALSQLDRYSMSKLVAKDNEYFDDGILNIGLGVSLIISDLKELLK